MAQPTTINPYSAIGQQLQSGLNAIILGLPANPTVDDLVNQVWSYIQPIYYTSQTKIEIEVKSVAYNAINSYRSNLVLNGLTTYDAVQNAFIDLLIGARMTSNTPPDVFAVSIADIEDNIGISELTMPDQQPLFLATTCGSNANNYWIAELANPQSSWASYFSSNGGQNYLNTMQWNVAAMNGALAGYGAQSNSLVEPTTGLITNQMVSALVGALTITAGKVIFNWTTRITKPLTLNVSLVSRLLDNSYEPQYATEKKTKGELTCKSCAGTCKNMGCPVQTTIDGTVIPKRPHEL